MIVTEVGGLLMLTLHRRCYNGEPFQQIQPQCRSVKLNHKSLAGNAATMGVTRFLPLPRCGQ